VKDSKSMQESEKPSSRNSLPLTLLGGLVAGIVSALLNIVITLLNAPTFQQAAAEGNNLQKSVAYTIVGLQCLSFLVSLLACFFVGLVVGRVTMQRRPGFYAGAIAGLITYIASFLIRYIPHYPGNLTGGATSTVLALSGIILSLVFLCIWGLIGGLIGLWGAAMVTRKHSAYAENDSRG
jgi:hypothetical protein